MSTQLSQLQMRRGTSAQWAAANPVLLEGEFGVDTTVDRFKIGDGVTAWASLGWAAAKVTVGTSPPASPMVGDVWIDTT